jgi:protein ImuB
MAALVLARARPGLTVVPTGEEAETLAPLPIALLEKIHDDDDRTQTAHPSTGSGRALRSSVPPLMVSLSNHELPAVSAVSAFKRWGLKTLGELAALPAADLVSRMGRPALAWQAIARGEDIRPLVPTLAEERFESSIELEWPIDDLEPLSFVLTRLLEPLSTRLERRDRGAAVLHVLLRLVTREVYARRLELPSPMRDVRTLRTLALLDLESHPPSAAIDRVVVAVDPTPGRVIQFSLLTRPLPSPEQLSTLMARLTALMGEGRCGSAITVDSWEPGVFDMKPFGPGLGIRESGFERSLANPRRTPNPESRIPRLAIRRFRFPIPARVRVDRGIPVRVMSDRRGLSGGRVDTYAGPWRTSGGWWIEDTKKYWERDEWDVTLGDGATYRVFRERDTDAWFIEGVVD